MNEQLRNLQIFRNGEVFVFTETINTVEKLKVLVESSVTLKDGEPISIRYKESEDGEVKGLFGAGYVVGESHKILWTGEEVNVNVESGSEDTDVIIIGVEEDPAGNFRVSAEATIATYGEDTGLADVTYVTEAINAIEHPEYTISAVDGADNKWQLNKDGVAVEGSVIEVTIPEAETYTIAKRETAETGYLATYELHDGEGNKVGDSINIPKDFLVKSGEVKTVTEAGQPYEGAQVGDKYIDFVINVKEGSATDEHMYLPVNELVDAYTEGNGIEISNTNVISAKRTDVVDNAVEITADGIYVKKVENTDTVTTVLEGTGINVSKAEDDEHSYTISLDDYYVTTIVNNAITESYSSDEFKAAVNDVVNHPVYSGSDSIVVNDDRQISLKVRSGEGVTNAIDVNENGVYVAPYTAGDGIDITENEISVKVSGATGNIISINEEDGGLIATLADAVKISDLKVVKNDTQAAQYWTVGSDNKITETTVESEAKITVPAGKKYLLIATSDKSLYGDVLPETDDTYVTSGEIIEVPATETTEAKTVIRLTRNDNTNVDVDMTDYVVVNAEAEYVNTTENPDTMTVSQSGKFTQDVMTVIEKYIDHYDCGTFNLTVNN